ncbi:hypothetical protein GGP70_003098 [Salinibacter ruber]|nr:hypothetical protein [Salinibacter ruber]
MASKNEWEVPSLTKLDTVESMTGQQNKIGTSPDEFSDTSNLDGDIQPNNP